MEKKIKREREGAGRRELGERKLFYFFSFCFIFFSDIRKLDRRFSSRLKAKLIMRRELRVGIKILEFRQTPQGRKFSYLCYF